MALVFTISLLACILIQLFFTGRSQPVSFDFDKPFPCKRVTIYNAFFELILTRRIKPDY